MKQQVRASFVCEVVGLHVFVVYVCPWRSDLHSIMMDVDLFDRSESEARDRRRE